MYRRRLGGHRYVDGRGPRVGLADRLVDGWVRHVADHVVASGERHPVEVLVHVVGIGHALSVGRTS